MRHAISLTHLRNATRCAPRRNPVGGRRGWGSEGTGKVPLHSGGNQKDKRELGKEGKRGRFERLEWVGKLGKGELVGEKK